MDIVVIRLYYDANRGKEIYLLQYIKLVRCTQKIVPWKRPREAGNK